MTNNLAITDSSKPAGYAVEITAADSDLAREVRALYIGGAGDVVVVTHGGSSVTFVGVLAGSILPVRCKRVSLATTATNIVGMY